MYYKIMNRAAEILNYVLMVMMPVGIFIMLTPALKEKYLWTSNIFIFIQFMAMLAYMLLNFSGKSVATAVVIMLISGYLLELIGIRTDFPFGSYFYTETLQPQVLGVPIAISISWVVVVAVSYLIVIRDSVQRSADRGQHSADSEQRSTDSSKKMNLFATVVYSSALVLAFDFMLEPFASFINYYWKWTLSFVPLQNYITWFLTAALFTVFLRKILVSRDSVQRTAVSGEDSAVSGQESANSENDSGSVQRIVPFTPVILYMVSIIQFSVLNIYHGYYIPTISGVILAAVILIIIYKKQNEV